jgi:hypothetical protein
MLESHEEEERRGTDLEVMDEGLHGFLHGCSWGWDDLVVIDLDGSGWHLVQTLVDDS